jgi:hypothetical protein
MQGPGGSTDGARLESHGSNLSRQVPVTVKSNKSLVSSVSQSNNPSVLSQPWRELKGRNPYVPPETGQFMITENDLFSALMGQQVSHNLKGYENDQSPNSIIKTKTSDHSSAPARLEMSSSGRPAQANRELPPKMQFNMGSHMQGASLNQNAVFSFLNPTIATQFIPQSLYAEPPYQTSQHAPDPGTMQKQHGQRHEMDTKLLASAFKQGSHYHDPALRVLLDLIRQQPFYMHETFEPSLESAEAEQLLAVVRQFAPQDPRFAPRIPDIHNAYAPPTGVNEPPKESIYMLFIENNMCLLCGKQTGRSDRALQHIRSDLEHRPYHCDCPKCLSSPKYVLASLCIFITKTDNPILTLAPGSSSAKSCLVITRKAKYSKQIVLIGKCCNNSAMV